MKTTATSASAASEKRTAATFSRSYPRTVEGRRGSDAILDQSHDTSFIAVTRCSLVSTERSPLGCVSGQMNNSVTFRADFARDRLCIVCFGSGGLCLYASWMSRLSNWRASRGRHESSPEHLSEMVRLACTKALRRRLGSSISWPLKSAGRGQIACDRHHIATRLFGSLMLTRATPNCWSDGLAASWP